MWVLVLASVPLLWVSLLFSGFLPSWWLLCAAFLYNHNVAWLPLALLGHLTKECVLNKSMHSHKQEESGSSLSYSISPLCVNFSIAPSWLPFSRAFNTRSAFGFAAEARGVFLLVWFFWVFLFACLGFLINFLKKPKDLFGNTEKFPKIFSGLLNHSCKNKVEKTFLPMSILSFLSVMCWFFCLEEFCLIEWWKGLVECCAWSIRR